MLHAIAGGGQEGWLAGAPLRTRVGDLLWVPPGVEQTLRRAGEAVSPRSWRET